MHSAMGLGMACWLIGCVSAAAVSPQEKAARHTWQQIAYPRLASHGTPTLSLTPGEEGLHLNLSWWVPTDKVGGARLPVDMSKISARLHMPDGKVHEPQVDPNDPLRQSSGPGVGNARGMSYHWFCHFAWGANVLEEAWVELRLEGERYWVEIPYGFTRNPVDPLPAGNGRNGKPAMVPALAQRAAKDHVLSWQHVEYNFGAIQQGWWLSVQLSNPFDAKAELVLYRSDSEVGKSMYLWDLHEPRTTIQIEQGGSQVLPSRCMSLRLHEDGMRRSDGFAFYRNPQGDDRAWGNAVVTVADKRCSFMVPSSLFHYVHGHAEAVRK